MNAPTLPGPLSLVEAGRDGADWYQRARESILDYARTVERDPGDVADVLAIVSPRVTVARSVVLARHYLESRGHFHPATMRGVRAALSHWEATGEIRGPKTAAFARALRGDTSAVVVDVWVIRALGLDERKSLSKAAYRDAEHRVRTVAGMARMEPASAQAAMWVGVRRAYNRTDGLSPLTIDLAA